ncbi:hypothetical protein [Candidatus Regiella insecticola]|nr:hypothetical protein [Candidatus Regiella insecticola]
MPLAGGIKSLTLEPGKIPVTFIMIEQEISPVLHGLAKPRKIPTYDDGLYVNEKVDVNAYGVEVKNNNKKQQIPQQAESFDFPSFITTDTDNDKIEKLAKHMVDNIFGLPVTDARRYYRRDTPKEKHDAAINLRSDVSKRLFIPFYSTAKDYHDGQLTFLGVIFGLLELASFLLPFGLAAKTGMRAAVVANKITVTSKTLTTLKTILAAKQTSKTLFWGLLDAANPFGFLVPLYQGGKKITLGLYKGYRWMHDQLALLPCLAQLKKMQNLPRQTLNKTSSYIDYLDRLYPPATMLLKPTVINTVKKIRTVPDMTVAKAEELIEKTFRYSGDLENTSIKMEIMGYLDNAAQHSPTFRRLLQRHKFLGSAPIHVNLSSTYSQPRAYPDPKTLSRDYFNQHRTEDFTQLWNKHKTHTIEMPSAEKISQLKYFSYDGEHEFTLVQAMMHQTVRMLTGLKDIDHATAINGVSIAGRGVGPVDHLTDIILTDMGKKIPLRVVYATEEFKQAYTAGAVRTQALKTAFEQTLAERRAINKQLKEILAQSDKQTVIERTKIDKRRTVAETLFFIKDLNAIRDAIERLSAQDTANAFNGLVKWEFDAALDPALHARYQQDFQRLLTQSEGMKKDALLWWHKKGRDAQGAAWSLRVEPAVITATATPLALEVKSNEKKIIVRHSDNWVYLSDQGIKPLETIRLAALTLQKMFIQPFKNQLPTMLSSDVPPISAKDRGYEVVRAQAALVDIGYSALPTQISHLIANKDNQNEENYDEDDEGNNITIKKLLQIQHQATLAAWKEDHFLAKPS